MRTVLYAALAASLALPALAEVPEPDGLVVLTLGGAVTEGNSAAPDPTKLGFFRYLELDYTAGAGFDMAMLDALPQKEIATTPYGPDTEGTYAGPTLAGLLEALGASGKTALPMAMDGYQVEIPWDIIEKHDPIIATTFNGAPLAIGQLGPTVVIFPPVEDEALRADLEALSVFAVAFIGVE